MKEWVTEFVGTFFLVLTIGLSVAQSPPMAPWAIGVVLTALVYMGREVSGAHYNPAVSVALILRGVFSWQQLGPYLLAQFLAAVAAAGVVNWVTGEPFYLAPASTASAAKALVVEALCTFLMVLVILNVATSKRTEGNGYFGLAIGFVVGGMAYFGGPISGGAYNPAVGVGPILLQIGSGAGSHAWLYLAGPLVGAVLAVVVFNLQEVE